MNTVKNNYAVVFGLFETGLGVIRSLAKAGIEVIGIDHKKDSGYYSRLAKSYISPHPVKEQEACMQWIADHFSQYEAKIPVFFTSDDFLSLFSEQRDKLESYFVFNLPPHTLLTQIEDKYKQYLLARKAAIALPLTVPVVSEKDLDKLNATNFRYPLFIKGLDVLSWRAKVSGSIKGYRIDTVEELTDKATRLVSMGVPVIVQEIIEGPDTNHYKYCCYIDKSGKIAAEFTLRKIRQNPIHFGVGAVVESIRNEALLEVGRKLFRGIGYCGVGSAEFKLDQRDNRLKLIEINPRYWQQNYLATYCGINFPLINYNDLTDRPAIKPDIVKSGVKWVNPYMDFDSFLGYRKEKRLTFKAWRKSLKGKKVYANLFWDDPMPVLYELNFGIRLFKIPIYLVKRLFKTRKRNETEP